MIRTYSELKSIETLQERYNYLRLNGRVGDPTFGFDRWLNQQFYRSTEWRNLRHHIIARDNGCDLGIEGYEIHDSVIIHHMNPMTSKDITHHDEDILNPEFLISTTLSTHNAIHYGDARQLPRQLVARTAGDTRLW